LFLQSAVPTFAIVAVGYYIVNLAGLNTRYDSDKPMRIDNQVVSNARMTFRNVAKRKQASTDLIY